MFRIVIIFIFVGGTQTATPARYWLTKRKNKGATITDGSDWLDWGNTRIKPAAHSVKMVVVMPANQTAHPLGGIRFSPVQ